MAKEIVSPGEPFECVFSDRSGPGGVRQHVWRVDSTNGDLILGNDDNGLTPPIRVAADGTVYINGAASVGSISGDLTVGGHLTMASNKDILCAAGTTKLDLSLGTGIFKSPSGAGTLSGTTTVAANKDLLCAAGTSKLDFSLGTGIFKSPSGANQLSGDTTLASGKNLTAAGGTTATDFSAASGVFKTSTGLNTIGGDLLMAANKIIAAGEPSTRSGPGAIAVTNEICLVTSTGVGDALTLAVGSQAGQKLRIVHHVDGGSAVVANTNVVQGITAKTITLTAVGDQALLVWSASQVKWVVVDYTAGILS